MASLFAIRHEFRQNNLAIDIGRSDWAGESDTAADASNFRAEWIWISLLYIINIIAIIIECETYSY